MKLRRHDLTLSLLWIGLLGCAGTSCKRDPNPVKPSPSASVSATAKPKEPVLAPANLVTLLRSRKFKEALRVAEGLPSSERQRPEVRFALAFAGLRSGDPTRALRELDGLSTELSVLTEDITALRALAEQSSKRKAEELSVVATATVAQPARPRLPELRKAAEEGKVTFVDAAVSTGTDKSVANLTKAEGAYLRGKARLVARTEQVEGAQFLLAAADRGFDKPTQLRLDAARMYVRIGDVEAATKLYDRVARTDRSRADEALYYAGRAQATLGKPSTAANYYAEVLRRFPRSRFADEARYERALNGLALGRYEVALGWLRGLLDEDRFESNRSMLAHLACVAMHEAGHGNESEACFLGIVRDYPLHLAGLFARARLSARALTIEPRPPSAPVTPKTLDDTASARVKQLLELGLDELAAGAFEAESSLLTAKARDRKSLCRNYGAIGFGGRGYALSSELKERVRPSEEATVESRWLFDCRFPTPYAELVQEFEGRYTLPEDLLFSVMRQESGFRPAIASSANALGLMQLLPETATRVALEFSLLTEFDAASEDELRSKLSEPRVSLGLGAAYFRKLLSYFDGNLVLAVAAYNAGPKAVALWLERSNAIPMELFAARIPYAETRNYVERVLMNLAMYRYLRHSDGNLPVLSLKPPKELKLMGALY